MVVTPQLPDAVAVLIARLEEWGVSTTSEEAQEGFGDRTIVATNPPIDVRLVSDRGQWFIELAHTDWDDWFDPDVWRACLNDNAIPDEPQPFTAQAEFLLEELERIGAAAQTDGDGLLACLRDRRAARSRRRLGLDV